MGEATWHMTRQGLHHDTPWHHITPGKGYSLAMGEASHHTCYIMLLTAYG